MNFKEHYNNVQAKYLKKFFLFRQMIEMERYLVFIAAMITIFLPWSLSDTSTSQQPFHLDPLAHQDLAFLAQGTLLPQSGFLHLRLAVPIQPYLDHCAELESHIKDSLERIPAKTSKIDSHFVIQLTELLNMCDKVQNFNKIFPNSPSQTRERRSMLAVGGALAGIFSLFSLGEILALEARYSSMSQRMDSLHDIIALEDNRVTTLETQFATLKESTVALTAEMITMSRNSEKFFSILILQSQIQKMSNIIHNLYNAAQALTQQKFPVDLLQFSELESTFQTVLDITRKKGLETPLSQIRDIFELPTSFVVTDSLVIFVHIPIFQRHDKMTLTKFLSIPIQTNEKVFINIDQENKFLAFTQNLQLAVELSEKNLEDCHTIGKVFLCPNLVQFRTSLEDTCLGALFSQAQDIESKCSLSMAHKFLDIVPMSQNSFLLTSDTQQRLDVSCGPNTKTLFFQGPSVLNLTYPCTARTSNHLLKSQLTIDTTVHITRKSIPFQNLTIFSNHSEEALNAILNKLKNSPDTDKITVRRVKSKLAELEQQDHISYLLKCILLPVTAVIIFCISAILMFKYKKNQRGSPDQTDQKAKKPAQSHSQNCSSKHINTQKDNVV